MIYKLYTFDGQIITKTLKYPFKFTGIIEYSNGSKQWFTNGRLHRLDGPAHEGSNGEKHWYINGKLHRLDGPACEGINEPQEYFVFGEKCSSKEHHKLLVDMMKLKDLI